MSRRRKYGQTVIAISLTIVFFFLMIFLCPNQNVQSYEKTGAMTTNTPPPYDSRAINRTAEIENILLSINESLLASHIQKLQDYKTRYAYYVNKCYQASESMYSLFERNGLDASYDEFVYKGWNMRNVIGEKPGTSTSDAIFIICAHYDSISGSASWFNAPGADDNGSGTAAVMTAAEILSDYEFNYTIRFIAFSGEELGLRGSAHYAENANAAGENVSGVINLDMIAHNPDPPSTAVNLNTNTLSEDLADFTVVTAQKYQNISKLQVDKNINPATNSDHASFWTYGYKAHMLIEKIFNSANYHLPTDTIDKLNMTYCANVTQIAIATIAELAELNSTDNAPPAHTPGFPPPNGYGNATPTISIEITDPTDLNISSLEMWVNGIFTTPNLVPIPLGCNVTFVPALPYTDGQIVNVTLCMNDSAGNGFNYSWEFTVDATPPDPPTNFTINLTRIEAVKRGLVIDLGTSGEGDSKHALSPSVIYHEGEFKMWYTGHNGSKYHIMYANSTDGISWNKHGVVLTHGDSGDSDVNYVADPTVIYDEGEYKMWYSGDDASAIFPTHIMYANSTDGLLWNKHGSVIDIGPPGSLDSVYANHPSVVKTDEYEMWYSSSDNNAYRISYANSSDGINWVKHPTHAIENTGSEYERILIIHPSVVYDDGRYHMWYTGYDGLKRRTLYSNSTNGIEWQKSGGRAIDVGTSGTYDPFRASQCSALMIDNEVKLWYSAYDQYFAGTWRIMYSNLTPNDDKSDLSISWSPSTSADLKHYDICLGDSPSVLSPWETHTQWNHSSFVENGLGDENNTNRYYKVRATDKVGNTNECDIIVGKIGTNMTSGWSLIGNSFLEGNTNLARALTTAAWDFARCYDAYDQANPWKSNVSDRPSILNTLESLNQTTGIWTHVNTEEIYVAAGTVKNITLNLQQGWNLITYPHHETMTVETALTGLPWDIVEGFNESAEYDLMNLAPSDYLYPGMAYWIHMTSAAVWDAVNL